MLTLRIELTGNNALKALEELERKKLIRIIKEPGLDSYALPGDTISEVDFKKWIEYTENAPTVSSEEAKKTWATQKKRLQKLIR